MEGHHLHIICMYIHPTDCLPNIQVKNGQEIWDKAGLTYVPCKDTERRLQLSVTKVHFVLRVKVI